MHLKEDYLRIVGKGMRKVNLKDWKTNVHLIQMQYKTIQNRNVCTRICVHTEKRLGKAAYEAFAFLRNEQYKRGKIL